jgi:branched-chain amino acid transport system substrate-binding protein
MRKSLVALAAAGAVLACVAGAGAGRSAVPLQVAVLVPPDGYFAAHNELIAEGAQIAADESGTSGPIGRVKISLVKRPLAPDASPSAVMQSLLNGGIHVVMLPCDVDATPALAKAGSRAGMLMLLPCDPDPRLPASTPLVWPTGMAGNEQAAVLVGNARALNVTKGYILSTPGTAYTATMARYFQAAAKLAGVKILGASTVDPNGKNVSAVAAAILKQKPAAIFAAIFSPYGEKIIAGLRKHGVESQPIYTPDGMDADEQLKQYGTSLGWVDVGSFGFPRPTSKPFFADYKAAYGHDPEGSFPSLGYETIHVLDTAVSRAGSSDVKAIDDAFANGFSVTGVALEDIQYLGKGNRIPQTYSAYAGIVRGQHVAMSSSIASEGVLVPAP